MLEMNCPTCACQYNYTDRSATIVCPKKHTICRRCANQVQKYNKQCPICDSSSYSSNPYGRESFDDRPSPIVQQNQPYSQPNVQPVNFQPQRNNNLPNTFNQPYQNYNAPTNVNRIQNAYPPQNNNFNNQNPTQQNIQPNPNQVPIAQPPLKWFERIQVMGCFLAVSAILFYFCLSARISMENCGYWGLYSCYYYEISGYECCINYCPQSWFDSSYVAEIILTTIGASFFGATTLLFFILVIRAQRINKRRRMQRTGLPAIQVGRGPVYVRV